MSAERQNRCRYVNPDGWQCEETCEDLGLCYWHDPKVDKSQDDITQALENWAKSGKPLDGFQLSRANLSDVNLVKSGSKLGYSCRNVDLYRADLTDAHLFGIDLRGSSLMKAKLSGANLNCAHLERCNVLGADFSRTRFENVDWGHKLHQEIKAEEAEKQGDKMQMNSLYQEVEEVCRNIRKQCEREGLFEIAGHFFKKEMRFRRYQMPRMSMTRWISKAVDVFCGYGESPLRVVAFSLLLITVCAIVYFFLGTTSSAAEQPVWLELLTAFYFSIVTFTTLGYGDIAPQGFARFVAAAEAFLGSFTMALFVVVFVKKMTR
jgi:hypothetical protein